MDAFLDAVLNIVSAVVFAAVAIPVLALFTELFYAVPLYVFVPIVAAIVILVAYAWPFAVKRWQSP
ncbi:MAG: hypothetical protein WBQ24_09825 [Xanthobacteraceae bacterium]